MNPEEKKSIKIEAEIAQQMAFEKVKRGKDIYVLIRESWNLYRGTPQVEVVNALSVFEQKWVDALLRIFRSNNRKAISAITSNLAVFDEFVDLDHGQKQQTQTNAAPQYLERDTNAGSHEAEHRADGGNLRGAVAKPRRKTGTSG